MQPPSTENTEVTPSAPPAKRRRRWPIIAEIAFFVLIVLGGSGFVVASALEEHDTFCISCHTVPETTYYNRAQMALDNKAAPVPDLATIHYQLYQDHGRPAFECINCHRGDSSLGQRISTLALGGRDALIYVLGREDPTLEKTQTAEGWLPNAACVSCHTDSLLRLAGVQNHFHNRLPQAAQALANGGVLTVADSFKDRATLLLNAGLKTVNVALTCTDCHEAHQTLPNGANNFFLDVDRRNKACIMCHQVAKEGPQDINSLAQGK